MAGQDIGASRQVSAPRSARQNWRLSRPSSQMTRRAVTCFFVLQVIAVTLLQKFSIDIDLTPFGLNTVADGVEVALPLMYLGLILLFTMVRPKVDWLRVGVFLVFLVFVIISLFSMPAEYSVNSLLLALALYIPFVIYFEIDRKLHKQLMNIFITVMIGFSFMVFIEHIVQLTFGANAWPNLDKIVNGGFLFPNYVYIQPIQYGSKLMKPNAIFFLEVSLLSQWIAIAAALELIYFQRLWRLAILGVALLLCFAGTGLLLILLGAPFLLTRLSKRSMTALAATILIGFVVSAKVHWLDHVQQRFGEYQVTGGSANHRFVEPIEILSSLTQKPSSVFQGEGPGSGQKTHSAMWWVSTKLAYEYGFAAAIAFVSFIGLFLFRNAVNIRFSFMLFIFFNIMYGFIIPSYVVLLFILGGLFRYKADTPEADPTQGPLLRKVYALISPGAGASAADESGKTRRRRRRRRRH
jgi:hypothetical protein